MSSTQPEPHPIVPTPRIALLGSYAVAREQLALMVRGNGWLAESITPADLRRGSPRPWDVIVLAEPRITAEVLLTCAASARDSAVRVLVVAADRDPQHVADALRSGADDYLATPFALAECLARIASLVSHARAVRGARPAISVDAHSHAHSHALSLRLDPATRVVRDGTALAALSAREWEVLQALLGAEGRPTGSETLATSLWGSPGLGDALTSTVSRLRRKLARCGVHSLDIETVRGHGYVARVEAHGG